MAAALAGATILFPALAARAQCDDCDCGSHDKVCGRLVYSNVDTAPELAEDEIVSSCCVATGGTGCDDNDCESAVVAMDATCGNEWSAGCVDLARQFCSCLLDAHGYWDDCIGSTSSIFVHGLADGLPIPHVTVELRGSPGDIRVATDVTDSDGGFCLCAGAAGGTFETPNTLRVKAKNSYVTVKKSKIVPLFIDDPISVDFEILQEDYPGDGGVVDRGDVGIDDHEHRFSTNTDDFPFSRALFVCGAIHTSAENVIAVSNMDPYTLGIGSADLGEMNVRLGYEFTAWYQAYVSLDAPTIHLPGTNAAVVWHEYGHHLENKLGAFGIIPGFVTQLSGHDGCCELTFPVDGGILVPDFCWSFLEGLATWYGAVNSYALFGDPPNLGWAVEPDWVQELDCDGVGSAEHASHLGEKFSLGDNWGAETTYCGSKGAYRDCDDDGIDDTGTWQFPETVESITANVLWDLVDSHIDEIDRHDTDFLEVAQVDVAKVLSVLTADTGWRLCGWEGGIYNHPVTLEDFCETYKELYRSDTPHGVFPDLYAAYAFNLAATGCAADNDPPEAVSITSDTHKEGVWSKEPVLEIAIDDGPDDMSGSYYYWQVWDHDSSTDLSGTSTIGTENFQSKETHNAYEIPINAGTAFFEERGDHYWHVYTCDVAQHCGPTTTYGPVMIDLTKPEFVSLTQPESLGFACDPANPPYAIGTFLQFSWVATDACVTSNCLPSGVDYVQIVYRDDATGYTIPYPEVHEAIGFSFIYLDPDRYRTTCAGRFYVTVYDRAGNASTMNPPYLTLVEPFEGPCDDCPNLVGAVGERTVSGDLDCDGDDEVIMSAGLFESLYWLNPLPCAAVACLGTSPGSGMSGGDLFLADTTGDGNLDLIAAGRWDVVPPIIPFQIREFKSDPTVCGDFVGGGVALRTGLLDMRVRVVDLTGNGDPILIYMGRTGAGVLQIGVYNFGDPTMPPALSGVTPVLGDFEVGDVDADGDFDFVMAGTDAAGVSGVFYFEGDAGTWTRRVVQLLDNVSFIDVDLSNMDNDRDLDLFVMYETISKGTATRVTRLYEFLGAPGTPFLRVESAANFHSVAEGDGHIVDIYNDGYSDVLAMGRLAGGGALQGWQLSHQQLGYFGGGGLPPSIRPNPRYRTDTAWGDFDADGSLDVFVVGHDGTDASRVEWYRNLMSDYGKPNVAPHSPIELASEYDVDKGGYWFKWKPPVMTDETASEAFGYELRVGSSPGGNDIVSWAHMAGPSLQPAAQWYGDELERFISLDFGCYYWTVRTVDSGWLRSLPAPEQYTCATVAPPCHTVAGDCDHDSVADACETDTDRDGTINDCDDDDDNDGVPDVADPYPLDPRRCIDTDRDGCDDCSIGTDRLGYRLDFDVANDGVDTDKDGVCDAGDTCPLDSHNDSDGDGVCDSDDICPVGDDHVDFDVDGVPDFCDPCPQDNPDDSDGDGVCDCADVCPGGDDALDTDRDGVPDICDPCPLDAAGDSDGDGVCDSDDKCLVGDDALDSDGDGVPDACDGCPNDNPNDSDYDAVCDSADVCPGGDDYLDSDGDSTPDYCEDCNYNGIPDGQELVTDSIADTNENGVLDTCEPNDMYVDPSASFAVHDGTSWCRAFTTLHEALSLASTGDTIFVANGLYIPASTGLVDPREATFRLVSGVEIRGGYAGCGASEPNARNTSLYASVLNGDLADNDAPVFVNYADNVYHVVSAGSGVANAVLDGVTIRGGNANGVAPNHQGGGLWINRAAISVRQCFINENRAEGGGGGIYLEGTAATMTITDSTLTRNESLASGGAVRANGAGSLTVAVCELESNTGDVGGAISINATPTSLMGSRFEGNTAAGFGGAADFASTSPDIVRCTFVSNSANGGTGSGGAMRFIGGAGRVANTRFLGNSAFLHGGALSNLDGGPTLIANCLFSGNTAGGNGGAVWSSDAGLFDVLGCTFSANAALGVGGGMHSTGSTSGSHPAIANAIFWLNSDASGTGQQAQIRIAPSSSSTLNFSCVQSLATAFPGVGNFASDPEFVDADGADGIVGTKDDDLRLRVVSPCIDAGGNGLVPPDEFDLDFDGEVSESWSLDLGERARFFDLPRVVDVGMGTPPVVDCGAFERQRPGDSDGDGDLDLEDTAAFVRCMSGPSEPASAGCTDADADGDGTTSLRDASVILADFDGSP